MPEVSQRWEMRSILFKRSDKAMPCTGRIKHGRRSYVSCGGQERVFSGRISFWKERCSLPCLTELVLRMSAFPFEHNTRQRIIWRICASAHLVQGLWYSRIPAHSKQRVYLHTTMHRTLLWCGEAPFCADTLQTQATTATSRRHLQQHYDTTRMTTPRSMRSSDGMDECL